ncbi:MAG: aminopeptidase P family protein [Eubacterium sp.]|nr:aminopeptidase P family protein [Candidatus Colimonas fimequi]
MNIYQKRLAKLRQLMAADNIDYYIVPTEDYHSSEYVGAYFKCREYVSGFTGSAGTLVVGMNDAGLWTDGRYFIQAEAELEGSTITLFKSNEPGVPTIKQFLQNARKDADSPLTIGYDGRTVSYNFGSGLREALADSTFIIDKDLVDDIWEDRPTFPNAPIWLMTDEQAGKSRTDKLADLRSKIGAPILISTLDDIAWLYNYRGDDILYTPVALAYTLVSQDEAILYISPDAVSEEIAAQLEADGVTLKPYLDIYEDITKFAKIQIDKASINEALTELIAEPVFKVNPTLMAKAVKNPTEIANERIAHLKDGIAFTKAICWLKKLAEDGAHRELTELDVSAKILELRAEQEDFISLSFESIVATGSHGAIIHYDPTPETNVNLGDGFLLMDTGAQYLQGTTDVTRTIIMGQASELEKTCYTAVLRGNLNLGAAIFPKGTTGNNLDVLARSPLWEMGLDFNHGTGHGVGYLLNVHEGPNAIRKTGIGTPWVEGMITSNEPGVYMEDRFGIRLENLILCHKLPEEYEGGQFYDFETLTLVPFDRDAIMANMMSPVELDILNEYHARVYEELSPYMTEEECQWLYEATAPIYYE